MANTKQFSEFTKLMRGHYRKPYQTYQACNNSKNIIVARNQEIKKYPPAELEFLNKAISEVLRCSQVLKYTYVYGFFIQNLKEQCLFQFMQQNLEKNCNYLHELIEKPLDPYLDTNKIDRKTSTTLRANQ
eukprot:403375525